MPRTKKAIYVTDRDGKRLFVHVRHSGIHPLVVMVDGMTLTYFGRRDGPYLDVVDIIAWHEKELRESGGRSGSQKLLEAFRTGLTKFREGKIAWDSPPPAV
jgi:hypothetical protein